MNDLTSEAEETVASRPAADPDAVEHEQRKRQEKYAGLQDRDGLSFDPRFHKVDADGEPILNKDGSLRRKSGKGSPNSRPVSTAPRVGDPAAYDAYRATATGIVESVQMLGMLVGGDEWRYIRDPDHGIDERAQGIEAWTGFCEAYGMQDFPPGVAVAIWGTAYVGVRLTQPKTQSRLKAAWYWARSKVSRNKGNGDARRDSRDHEQR